jgi:hypothetical protein
MSSTESQTTVALGENPETPARATEVT